MKSKNLLVIIVFIITVSSKAQVADSVKVNHEMAFDFVGMQTPLLTKNFFGISIDLKSYVCPKWSTGLDFSYSQKIINNKFQYTMGTPIVQYYEIGWVNQFDFVQTNKLRIAASLTTGIAISCLADNDDKLERHGKYGNVYVPRGIATDNLFIIEPGFETYYKIYNGNHYSDIYITTKAKYRFASGGPKYGDINDFNGSYIGIGLSVIGLIGDNPKHNECFKFLNLCF